MQGMSFCWHVHGCARQGSSMMCVIYVHGTMEKNSTARENCDEETCHACSKEFGSAETP